MGVSGTNDLVDALIRTRWAGKLTPEDSVVVAHKTLIVPWWNRYSICSRSSTVNPRIGAC
jgi:hypothetical protein